MGVSNTEIGHRKVRRTRRDLRGRGVRGIKFSPLLPAFRTRREIFDEMVIELAEAASALHPQVRNLEFGVEDVPPSQPGYYDLDSPVLARLFPANRAGRVPARMVIYRLPIQYPARTGMPLREALQLVLAQQLSSFLGCPPEEVFAPGEF